MLLVVVTVAFIFAPVVVSTPIIPAIIMLVPVFPVVFFLVTRDIVAFIPVVLHKIDPFAAGVVSVAIFAPMVGVISRYTQINGRAFMGNPLDNYRLTIEHAWRWVAAYVELAIEARLADTDRDAHVGCQCRTRGSDDNGDCRCDKKSLHVELSFCPVP